MAVVWGRNGDKEEGEREENEWDIEKDRERKRDERPCEWERKAWYLGIKY